MSAEVNGCAGESVVYNDGVDGGDGFVDNGDAAHFVRGEGISDEQQDMVLERGYILLLALYYNIVFWERCLDLLL